MRSNEPRIFNTLGRDMKRSTNAPSPFENLYDDALSHFLAHMAYLIDSDDLFAVPSSQEDMYDMYEEVDVAINRVVGEVIPPREVLVDKYASADPTLMTPSSRVIDDHPGKSKEEIEMLSPEQFVEHNVKTWVKRSLWDFWMHRWRGERKVAISVSSNSISVEKVLPPVIMNQIY